LSPPSSRPKGVRAPETMTVVSVTGMLALR